MKRIKQIGLSALYLLVPGIVLAQTGIIPPPPAVFSGTRLGDSGLTVTNLILYIINIVLVVVGIISVLFIIIGGFRYITSAGSEEQAEAGKKTIQNAIIGLIVVILSYVIIATISNALIGNV